MKKINFQFSILNFQLITVFLLFAACNNFSGNRHAGEQLLSNFAPDSLWTPTGDAELDSLLQLAAISPQDTNLIKLYYEIGDYYHEYDYETAKGYYLKAGALSEQLDWNRGRYLYATNFAHLLLRESLTDSALVIFQKTLELVKREKNELWIADILTNIGMVYHAKDWDEAALRHYTEASHIYEKRKVNKTLTLVYSQISQIYTNLYAMEKAIEYGEKSVALSIENEYALTALARAYSSDRQYEKAINYFEEALRICKSKNNIYGMGIIYFSLGVIAMNTFDFERAEKYAQQSLENHEQFGYAACCADYIMQSKLELLKGNYSKSEELAKKALQIAIEIEALRVKRLCYGILSELAAVQQKPREIVQYWNEADLVDIEIAKEKTFRASEEMAAKYETAKKELEIEKQKQIIARHNMQRWFFSAGIAVCVVIVSLLWYILRLRNRRNRELVEINRTKDKFFNIISHDLKNPAIAQRDTLQILVKNARTWDADTLADYHGELLKSAEGGVELIYNLLKWAQLQTGRISCTPETFPLSDLRSHLSLINKMAENKNIALNIQIPENALVTADSHILTTVIRNLLTNAVKFTAAGGTVTLDISPCHTGYCISVSDTGIGISEKQLHNLFRLDGAHSQQGTAGEQGSGLGLIVCKELVEKHGSTLHVESEEGKGSRFWFEL